jgi:NADH:ubiquinone oxidoreductase subunit 6 (subunit J)
MGFEKFLFYVFAAITVYAAGMVVTRRNPVQAVLYLVLAFVGSAALWLLLEAEFLGIVLVLVYVGAVMVLFLFVVMMLDIDIAAMRAQFIRYLPLGLVIAGVMVFNLFLVLGPSNFGLDGVREARGRSRRTTATPPSSAGALHHLSLSVRDRRGHPAGRHHRGDSPDACATARRRSSRTRRAGAGAQGAGSHPARLHGARSRRPPPESVAPAPRRAESQPRRRRS